MKKLIVIAGPTAVGKTEIAIQIAKKLQTEIISADSRQLYKELSIGTAKPSPAEQKGIVHHFIDSVSITDSYSVGKYEKEALERMESLFEKYETLILVGGTGLYIKALLEGLDEFPEINPSIRIDLQKEYEIFGLDYLGEELRIKDLKYYESIDNQNKQRIMRALEVIRSTGKKISDFRKAIKKERNFKAITFVIDRPRIELYERCDERVLQMIEKGLVREVENLLPHRSKNALQTVGYREVFDFLDKKISFSEMTQKIQQNTRHYAKRQLTWFRNQASFEWIEAEKAVREIETIVLRSPLKDKPII